MDCVNEKLVPKRDEGALNYLFLVLLLYFADNSFSGSGKLISVGDFSLRNLLAVSLIIFGSLVVVKNIRILAKLTSIKWLIAFSVVLSVSAIIGLLKGNNYSIIRSDLIGFAYFFLLPISLILVPSQKKLERALRWVFFSSTLLAVLSVIIQLMFTYKPSIAHDVLYNQMLLTGIGFIDQISDVVYRVFLKSIVFSFLAVCYGFNKILQENAIRRIIYISAVILHFFAILLTYSRSIYLGILMTLIIYAFLTSKRCGIKKPVILLSGILFIFLTFTFCLGEITHADYLTPAVRRTSASIWQPASSNSRDTAVSEENSKNNTIIYQTRLEEYISRTHESDNIRRTSIDELTRAIANSPIIGNGLGYSAPSRRYQEFFYLDLAAKSGILALLIYTFPLVYICCFIVFQRNKKVSMNSSVAIPGLIGVSIVSLFNPYMNSSIGIAIYILAWLAYEQDIHSLECKK